jgi:hypothetical protein
MSLVTSRISRIARRLLRAPLFSAVAILTLAVGIGANTAIFSVVNGVLLKPLPFRDSGSLVSVWHQAPGINIPRLNMGPTNYFIYREENRVFEDIGMWDGTSVTITGTGEPDRVLAMYVSDGTLPILGVNPLIGRQFTKADDSPGAPDRVMLMHSLWQRKFGGDPNVVGRSMTIDGKPFEVIGVLPEGFRFLDRKPQLLMPFQFDRAKVHAGNFSYQAVARLKPGVTLEQANADVGRMIPLIIERFPLSDRSSGSCSARSAWCSSSPAPMSPTCSWFVRKGASRSSRSMPRLEPAGGASPGSCCRNLSPLRQWAAPLAC